MLTTGEPAYTGVEIVEGDGEVARVAAGRLDPEAGCSKHADTDEGQHLETNQRRLLRELFDGEAPGGEHRDAKHAVHVVVSAGILPQDLDVKLTASHDHDIVVIERVTESEVPPLSHLMCSSP
ncbi:MAG: hypothetical protein ACRD1K_05530 [Acidimicrobiales bacterium]